MKAAVLYGKGDLRVENIEKPLLEEKEVLIKIMATGICGSDFSRVLEGKSHYFPNVLGHEFSGKVVAVGPKTDKKLIGKKVSCAPLKPCHQCLACQQGDYGLCKNYAFIGSREFGAWAEYMKAPEKNIVLLPDKIDYLAGAFIEPLTVALHGVMLTDIKPFDQVAILGMGTIGLLTLQCLKDMGMSKITAFDMDEKKLKIALDLGAETGINTLDKTFIDQWKSDTKGQGYACVIETAGVPFTSLMALDIAGNKGQVTYIGTPHETFEIRQDQFENINRKELTVRGSWMSYSLPFPGKEWTISAGLLADEKVQVGPLIDRAVKLEDFPKAFEDIKAKKVFGKVIGLFEEEALDGTC